MGEEFRIDSFEPFVVGMKLKPEINMDSIQKNMRRVLKENDFEIPPETPGNIKIGPPIEILGLNNGVEFKFNIQTKSFNIEGEKIEDVIKITKKVPDFLDQAEFNFSDTIDFSEIIANIIVETGSNPRDKINKSCNIDLNSISDLDTYVSGIKIGSVGESSKNFVNFIIQPRVGNPTKLYHLNCVYRFEKLEELINLSDELPNIIENLLDSLER